MDAAPPQENNFITRFLTSPLVPEPFRDEEIAESLQLVVRQLIEDNTKFNLTAITDPDDIFEKHIVDSLLCAEAIRPEYLSRTEPGEPALRLLDVGSGAGFPALPIAAALPLLSVTAIDSTAKKCRHMNDTASAASISNFIALPARAENLAKNSDYREQYHFVTARAVARLPILCELCLPFVAPGGLFVAMKGQSGPKEAEEAEHALSVLGASIEEIHPYSILRDENPRYLLLIRKNTPTNAIYPRHFSQISKNPL